MGRTKPGHKNTAKPDVLLEVHCTSWKCSPTHINVAGGEGGAEFAVPSFVMTSTCGTTHSHSCSVFLSCKEGRVGVMEEAQAWKAGELGLSLALSFGASISIAVKWESWTNKPGTPSCSDTWNVLTWDSLRSCDHSKLRLSDTDSLKNFIHCVKGGLKWPPMEGTWRT